MRTHVGSGDNITIVAPSALTAGVPVVVGGFTLVPLQDAASGEEAACLRRGEVELVKDSAADISAGDLVEWSNAGGDVVAPTAGDFDLGLAVKDAGVGTTTVRLVLNQ